MSKANIRFRILNNQNKLVTINATLGEDKRLYRCGTPIYCNCHDSPTPYLFIDGEVYCPCCGKKSLSVETFTETLSNIHLTYFGTDYNTMQDLYKLSDTLPYTTWNLVADYFVKLTPAEVDLGYSVGYVGWVTSNPEKVEEVLNVRDELKVCNQEITKDDIMETGNQLSEVEIFDIVDRLHEVFSVVETPYGEFQLYTGDVGDDYIVSNPLFPPNPHIGNGECWYVKHTTNEIWYIRYNYRDGDDLRMNNVLIDFELKAIGKVIAYDEDVEKLIMKLKEK
ncbi:MAG: hypothetical protein IJH63_00875 [Methanobrevibacter sp.]|nr:hypothetical protein [Methanobrevibacter sp.]